jgi:signal transduction histidine kinase
MSGKVMREGRFPGSIVITSRNITERKQAERIIKRQAESERLVAEISDKFARMASGQLDEAVNHALRCVGEFVSVDSCRLFLLSDDGVHLTNTHEWCAPGIPSQRNYITSHPFYQKYDWWHQQLLTNKVIHISTLDQLPPEMHLFADELARRQVKSLATVPLMRSGKLLGEIGFDAIQQPKTWNHDEIRILRVVSEMIVSVLDREQIARALQAQRNLLEQRVQERTLELSKLLDVSRAISSNLQLPPMLGQVLESVREVVPFTTAAISEFTQNLDLLVVAYRGYVPDDELVYEWRYEPETDLHIFELMQSRLPIVIDDARSDTLLARAVRGRYDRTVGEMDARIVNVLFVPLVAQDRLVGMMALTCAVPSTYTAAHARLAMTFANQAAIAIENGRLHEREVQAAALAERSRLARELHDSVSQALFGIVLGSRTLLQKAGDAPDLVDPMNYVLRLAEAALAEMRALIFELRPESLEQEGLIAAFEKQAQALCARHQIEVDTQLGRVEPELPIEAKEALYRIGLEAIQNTIKHAKAKRVELHLNVDAHNVALEVCDDGIGFDVNGNYPGHLGLISMRERAEKCGGRFDVGSRKGHGTAVRVQLPVGCACR